MNKPSLTNHTVLLTIAVLSLNACCNRLSLEREIDRRLDSEDAVGALGVAKNKCLSDIDGIDTLRAVLIFRIRMDEVAPERKEAMRKEGLDLLRKDAAIGHPGAQSILDGYSHRGEDFWSSFPWGGVMGHGSYPGQGRSWPPYE